MSSFYKLQLIDARLKNKLHLMEMCQVISCTLFARLDQAAASPLAVLVSYSPSPCLEPAAPPGWVARHRSCRDSPFPRLSPSWWAGKANEQISWVCLREVPEHGDVQPARRLVQGCAELLQTRCDGHGRPPHTSSDEPYSVSAQARGSLALSAGKPQNSTQKHLEQHKWSCSNPSEVQRRVAELSRAAAASSEAAA
jgi:hypothetical protein